MPFASYFGRGRSASPENDSLSGPGTQQQNENENSDIPNDEVAGLDQKSHNNLSSSPASSTSSAPIAIKKTNGSSHAYKNGLSDSLDQHPTFQFDSFASSQTQVPTNPSNGNRNMSAPKDIVNNVASALGNTLSLSTSPTSNFHSPAGSYYARAAAAKAKHLKPFATEDIKILLLENVNQTAQDTLNAQGYQVEFHKASLPEEELIEKIKDVHAIGIRSKTKLTAKVLEHAKNLLVIGCFCIGTNQVDLTYAAKKGIVVFNSPFSNSRSVAELVIGEIIALARQLGDRSNELHEGVWNKVSNKCWEIRGKTLGIVGYGHIGSQLSVLAEAMGMRVIYYDVLPIMALGSAKQVATLDDLLERSDFVTLHVPELPETKNMITAERLSKMKIGSYLINASRGTVVDIPALVGAMKSGRVAGAALDVFPHEPAANGKFFTNDLNSWAEELRSLNNLILTPHIGGSTEEAQSAIGVEVGDALVRYINEGSTIGAVNFPEVNLRSLTKDEEDHVRVIFIHANRPGVLRQVNEILGDHNVDKQMSDSRGDVAYLMADISDVSVDQIKDIYESLESLSAKILTRVLY